MEQSAFESLKNVLGNVKTQIFLPSDALINWNVATSIAFDLAGDKSPLGERQALQEAYHEMVDIVAPTVASYGGKQVNLSNPICVFDRHEWILANIENTKILLKPLSQRYWEALEEYLASAYRGGSWLKKASEVTLTIEIGIMLGYLSRKVLAQYDMPLPRARENIPQNLLYFVEPNILMLEKKFGLDPANLRLWVVLHELSHAYQFTACAWLRDYFNSLLDKYLKLMDDSVKKLKTKIDSGAKPLRWSRWWWQEILSPEHKQVIREIQAFMSLLEGYSDHLMFEAGKKMPQYEKMSEVFRKRERSFAQKILETIFGFNVKRQQYEWGERFVSYVVKNKGIDFFNQVWEDNANLPQLNEILNPSLWIARLS